MMMSALGLLLELSQVWLLIALLMPLRMPLPVLLPTSRPTSRLTSQPVVLAMTPWRWGERSDALAGKHL